MQLIALNKNLNIQSNVHSINILSSFIYIVNKFEAIRKIYTFFPFKAIDKWYRKRMMHEAVQLQVIIVQAANQHT